MPEPNNSPSISYEHAVLLASRVFAAFFLFWVFEDMTELPRQLFAVMHYHNETSQAGLNLLQGLRASYLLSDYMMYLLANILRMALWLLAAGWFYRCGPRIRRFFTAGTE